MGMLLPFWPEEADLAKFAHATQRRKDYSSNPVAWMENDFWRACLGDVLAMAKTHLSHFDTAVLALSLGDTSQLAAN